MARKLAGTLGRKIGGVAWWGLPLVLALGMVGLVSAQDDPTRPPRVRNLVKQGLEAYKRGDYLAAAQYYVQAQGQQKELTAAERQDLGNLTRQNQIALDQQADGQGQLRKAEELIQHGQVHEANALLRGLYTNQYLTPTDRKKVNHLMRSAQPGSGPPGELPRGDARHLLAGARAALKRGDLDTAENLARQAERSSAGGLFSWMHSPWSDTPAKVLRDVQIARSRPGPAGVRPPGEAVPMQERKDNSGPFATIKNIFRKDASKAESSKGLNPYPRSERPLPLPPGSTLAPATHAPQLPAPEKTEPPSPLQKMKNLFNANPKEVAPGTGRPTPFPESKPSSGQPQKTSGQEDPLAPIMPVKGEATAPKKIPGQPPHEATAQARQLVAQGYKALEANDLETARKLAHQARELRPDIPFNEDNPEKLLVDIQRRASTPAPAQTKGAAVPIKTSQKAAVPPADARALLREARQLFLQNKFDEAERLCVQAAAINEARWSLFEDSPDKLRTDLQRVRLRHDREEADRLLVEARKLFQQGYHLEAKNQAWKAKKLHGPYSLWDLGDRPDRLLNEIERTEISQAAKKTSAIAQKNQPLARPGEPGKAPGAPEGVQQAQAVAGKAPGVVPAHLPEPSQQAAPTDTQVKARAAKLLAEARDLQKKGLLLEARQKTIEARQLGAVFGADEDSPEMVLLSLAALCDRRIHQLLQQAGDKVATSGDPDRFGRAEADLLSARRLASTFGQDLARIDQKSAWIKQVQAAVSGLPAVAQVSDLPPPPPPQGGAGLAPPAPLGAGLAPPSQLGAAASADPAALRRRQEALDKLNRARLELKAGNTPLVRRLAEEVFLADETVREEAAQLLRSVDAEEFNQTLLAAQRNAQAGVEAFRRRDYRQATEIFKAIDLRLLQPQQRAMVREMLATPEMNKGLTTTVAKVTPSTGQASATVQVSDQQPDMAPKANSGLTDQFRVMSEIQFQQLREKGLAAQRAALEMDRAGDTAKAAETLKDYLDSLGNSGLEADKVALLRRPVENRLQQLRTLQAQRALEKEQQILLTSHSSSHSEAARNKALRKTQEEVGELMKQYQTLMKEGKFKEAGLAALKAKELDPDNVTADAAVRIATIQENQRVWDKNKAENDEVFLRQLDTRIGPFVDVSNPLHVDAAAAERLKNRKGTDAIWPQSQNPAEKAIERRLSQPINLNFKDLPLQQALEDLQNLSGVNIVPDKAAFQDLGVSLEQQLSLKVENVSLKSALNLLLQQARLTYVIKDEVLQITTPEKATGKMKQRIYPVADLVVPVENHPVPSVNSLHDALARHISGQHGTSLGYNATPYSPPFGLANGQPISSSQSTMNSGFGQNYMPTSGPQANIHKQMPNQTMEDLLINLITSTVRPDSWSSVGGPGTIQYYPLGMALIINQVQEVQEDVDALLRALRRLQDLEVAIEMKMVSVSEAFYEMMGVDFDINIRNTNSRIEPMLMTGQFAPPLNINRLPTGLVSGLTPAGTFTPDLGIPLRSSSFDFAAPPFGGFPGTLGADGGLSLGLAFLNDIQVFMFMEAAQSDRRTNVMQAPRITVFNGQTAFISVNDFQFFLLGVQLVNPVGTAQLFFQPQNEPIPLGMQMQVTPVVSADRRFVRLSLNPSMTNLASATVPLVPVQIPVPQLFEGPGSGATATGQPVIFQMFFQQPTFTQIILNTTVNVPDGGTVLLGGMKTLSEGRNEAGPPILSKIPYISRLFRNVAYGREAQSLMIMVTPRIIINEEEEQIFLGQLPPIPRP